MCRIHNAPNDESTKYIDKNGVGVKKADLAENTTLYALNCFTLSITLLNSVLAV